MIAYLLYNKATPAERWAIALADKLEHEQIEAEIIDADSPRGIQLAENYDIMGRPALALVKGDGVPVQLWQGQDSMPLVSDIVYLAHQ